MATLFNTKIKDTYQSLLKLEDNTILTTTSKNITDGLGNASPLYMSTTRIGIGTNTPTSTFEVNGTTSLNGQFDVINGAANFRVTSESTSYVALKYNASTWASFNANDSYFQGTQFYFQSGLNFRFAGSGSFGFTGNPSARLLVKGTGSTSATTSLLVQNSSGQQSISVLDDGSCTIGISGSTTNSLTIVGNTGIQAIIGNTQFQSPQSIYRYGGGVLSFFGTNNDGNAFSFDFNNQQSSTNVNSVMVNLGGTYQNQTSFQFANLRIAPTYNFNANTNTNAIARGIYYNPTLTNLRVAQHRAIETVTGDVLFGTTSGKATFGSGVAGTSYIEIKPGISNGFNRITFNDFDGGTATRGGFIEISTYLAQINFGSYNSFYLGNSSKPYNFYMVAGTSNIIISTGNIVPTDSGALFQVKGTGSTSATTSLLVQNSSGTTGFRVDDDSAVVIKSRVDSIDSTILFRAITSTALTLTASQTTIGNHTAFTNGFFDNLANTDYNFRMNTSGNAIAFRDPGRVWLNTTSSGTLIQNTSFGGTAIAASALLEVQSTTKGVLFPRMTTAQKLAIVSPVGGLQVFDTTLNQMSYYNGSAWINF